MNITVTWSQLKTFVDERSLSIQWLDVGGVYYLYAFDGPFSLECKISQTSPAGSDQDDFETNYKASGNISPLTNVVTQMEKNDKILRTICGFAETDSNGLAVFAIPVPSGGRYVAYGDAEFENRQFGDFVKTIDIRDLDGIIPAEYQGAYPLYPIIEWYDDKSFPDPLPENALGDLKAGMSLTFNFGVTEVQPIGGYGFIPEGFYLYIELQKATAVAGEKCQLSVDWAEGV